MRELILAAPQWAEAAKGAAAVAQAAAIVIGGVWAYFKFVRGRTFSPRLELGAKAEILEAGPDSRMLRATVTVRNTGLSVVQLSQDPKDVQLYATTSSDWIPDSSVEWSRCLRVTPIFSEHVQIESGETVTEEVAIPVPNAGEGEDWLAYRLDVRFGNKRRRFRKSMLWSTTVIVPGAARPVRDQAATTEEVGHDVAEAA